MPNRAMTVGGKLDPTHAWLRCHRSLEAAGSDNRDVTDVRGRLPWPTRAVESNKLCQVLCTTTNLPHTQAFRPRITPELSRAAKRLRLE